jgi:hypothetical protein
LTKKKNTGTAWKQHLFPLDGYKNAITYGYLESHAPMSEIQLVLFLRSIGVRTKFRGKSHMLQQYYRLAKEGDSEDEQDGEKQIKPFAFNPPPPGAGITVFFAPDSKDEVKLKE